MAAHIHVPFYDAIKHPSKNFYFGDQFRPDPSGTHYGPDEIVGDAVSAQTFISGDFHQTTGAKARHYGGDDTFIHLIGLQEADLQSSDFIYS